MHAVALLLQDRGLTLSEVVHDIPHDGAAVVVYVLVLGSIGLLWWANRRGRAKS
jgi:hypothetical protein